MIWEEEPMKRTSFFLMLVGLIKRNGEPKSGYMAFRELGVTFK